MLRRQNIGVRLFFIVILAIAGMVAIAAFGLQSLNQSLLADRQANTKNIVDATLTILTDLHRRADLKEFTQDEAQRRALEIIQALRYGANDYVFVYDKQAVVLYVPDKKAIGTSRLDAKDHNGVYFARDFVAKAIKGGGFTIYHYPKFTAAGPTEPLAKLSYTALFEPWGWVLGTGIYIDDVETAFWSEVRHIAAVGFVILALVVLAAVLIGRSITRPLTSITRAMERLANGDLSVAIEYADRQDEIGSLARALGTFKTNAVEIERLKAEQESLRSQAEAERKAAMLTLANHFEESVTTVVASVTHGADKMKTLATTLNGVAKSTGHQSAIVASGSDKASTNVQTVAAATQELTSSIAEISRQVSQASEVALRAKNQAGSAEGTISSLAGLSQKISDVVRLISSIAAQTNLLALNATIEAARAGEAGRGFAVVAGEVKSLATQTAHATEEISSQIAEVQEASNRAVAAINGINEIIGQINETSAVIAAAVEEQGAATREIGRNVEQAAGGTTEVSENIALVRDGAVSTEQAANDVLDASATLSDQIMSLRQEVEAFLTRIRTSYGDQQGGAMPSARKISA